jgi:tRNA 2-thiocytidine biosynthesis protein TtcA
MLRAWERDDPGRVDRIFDAMARVVPSHLMDRKLFPFAGLRPTGVADAEGDRAFDGDAPSLPAVADADRDGVVRFGSVPTTLQRRGELE